MATFDASFDVIEAGESDLLTEPARDAQPPRRAALLRRLGLAGLAAVLAAACLLALRQDHSGQIVARSEDLQVNQKSSFFDLVGTLADGVVKSADAVGTVKKSMNSVEGLVGPKGALPSLMTQFQKTATELGVPLQEQEKLIAKFQNLTDEQKATVKAQLKKELSIHNWTHVEVDANVSECYPDEEELVGLCYKKCSLLNASLTLRASPFTCCDTEDSQNCLTDLTPCGGNSMSGDFTGNGCPLPPGRCQKNEEFFMGVCYKRCAITSYNVTPFRQGPQTCCQKPSQFGALDLKNCVTDAKYGTGGQSE